MFIRIFDKVVFATLFVAALQVPILADHYRQYLSGYYDATREEVSAMSALAERHGYSSVGAMLSALKQNSEAVVRADAERKSALFTKLSHIEQGIKTLEHGHYYEKAWYMATPSNASTLQKVLGNFSTSVPLTPSSIIFSFITALLINLLLWSPYLCYCLVRHLKHKPQHASYR